ncbi:ExbD/TolR family protein [Parasulfitobacter algicola]|uniref:Biopolymer transporter ExbD n=1 Tax=Parasulfitobacter algicola TaxID=2614809 RepID=A0ABX2IWP5_9RHOB|nr:biopolymer transporter ExbD [Sulfitobacter algicola]NSX54786.1 biopolymer transporter ExbD [Sulfitobacter algicola]
MKFATKLRRKNRESIVPMINVVFLLLIFFLMTAQIVPPDPFEITPPSATTSDVSQGQAMLFLSQTKDIAFGNERGQAAIDAALAATMDGQVSLRADAAAPAAELARLVTRLSAAGATDIRLITTSP